MNKSKQEEKGSRFKRPEPPEDNHCGVTYPVTDTNTPVSGSGDYLRPPNLEYVPDEGTIVNHDANSYDRQIVLRVETFNKFLDSIYTYAENHFICGPDQPDILSDFVNSMLHSCGLHCGESFGDRIYSSFTKGRKQTIEALVDRWLKFDSKVGFGKMSQESQITYHSSANKLSGIIQFKYNFMSLYPERTSHERCIFIRGYSEGVLKSLARHCGHADFNFCIKCDSDFCQRIGKKSDCCRYTFEGSPTLLCESKKWRLSAEQSKENKF